MKRSVLFVVVAILMLFSGIRLAQAQEQPAPKKDTVNIDTDAKPEKYYDVEDDESVTNEKGGNSTIIIVAAAVIIIGGAAVMLLRKKK